MYFFPFFSFSSKEIRLLSFRHSISVSKLDVLSVCIYRAQNEQLFLISTFVDRFISNMHSPTTIQLERDAPDRPWGFRLQGLICPGALSLLSQRFDLGGRDFPVPLSIQLVSADRPERETASQSLLCSRQGESQHSRSSQRLRSGRSDRVHQQR